MPSKRNHDRSEDRAKPDERVALPLDPEQALCALLAVDPDVGAAGGKGDSG